MKILLELLSILNGCFMFADGIYVLINGKYIGPEKPGPWANLFYQLNIDVFKLGPLFILYGLAWFIFIFSFHTNQSWAYIYAIVLSLLTLWYLPFGTLISILILLLLIFKSKLGFSN